jgi:hypothetical protein
VSDHQDPRAATQAPVTPHQAISQMIRSGDAKVSARPEWSTPPTPEEAERAATLLAEHVRIYGWRGRVLPTQDDSRGYVWEDLPPLKPGARVPCPYPESHRTRPYEPNAEPVRAQPAPKVAQRRAKRPKSGGHTEHTVAAPSPNRSANSQLTTAEAEAASTKVCAREGCTYRTVGPKCGASSPEWRRSYCTPCLAYSAAKKRGNQRMPQREWLQTQPRLDPPTQRSRLSIMQIKALAWVARDIPRGEPKPSYVTLRGLTRRGLVVLAHAFWMVTDEGEIALEREMRKQRWMDSGEGV